MSRKQEKADAKAATYAWTVTTQLNRDEIMEVLLACAEAAPRVGIAIGSMVLAERRDATDGFVTAWKHKALARNTVADIVITCRSIGDGRTEVSLRLLTYMFKNAIGGTVISSGALLDQFRSLAVPRLTGTLSA